MPTKHDLAQEGTEADVYAGRKHSTREIAPAVERALPGIEVLAVELVSPSRSASTSTTRTESTTRSASASPTSCATTSSEYAVEVSSPGLERPLRKPRALRARGRPQGDGADRREIAAASRFRGEVVAAGDRSVTIAVRRRPLDIPYEEIVRGNLIDEG